MAPHQTKTIPEALLKLKAALEEGKRDDVAAARTPKEPQNEIRSANFKPKKTSFKSSVHPSDQPKWQKNTAKNDVTEKHHTKISHPAPERAEHNPKLHVESKPIPLSRNERVKTALAWLYETFPNLFKMNDRLPLKIGITSDIAAWIDAHKIQEQAVDAVEIQAEPQISFMPSKTAVRDAITVYTNTLLYQKSLLNNDKRYDLDGNEVGIVEEKQKEHADQRNATIEAAIQTQTEKREALRERRKMIADTWRAEKEAKKTTELVVDSAN